MKKKYFEVGYTFYPHEMLSSTSYFVHGIEEDAKAFLFDKLREEPLWIRDQIDKDFNSNSRTKVFCSPIEVHEV